MGLGKCVEKLKEGALKPRNDSLTGSKKEKAGVSTGKGVNTHPNRHAAFRIYRSSREKVTGSGKGVARKEISQLGKGQARDYPRLSFPVILKTSITERSETGT